MTGRMADHTVREDDPMHSQRCRAGQATDFHQILRFKI
jgi:hypothetical protein